MSISANNSSQFTWMTQVNFGEWLKSIFLNDSSQFGGMTRVNFVEWLESILGNDWSQFSWMTRVNLGECLESILGNDSSQFPWMTRVNFQKWLGSFDVESLLMTHLIFLIVSSYSISLGGFFIKASDLYRSWLTYTNPSLSRTGRSPACREKSPS